MNVPTIFEWLDRLDFLRGDAAAYGILITSVIILMAWEWRSMLLALMLQYMISGFLFVDLLDARLVNIKVLVGLFVCLMLYLTARQVNWGRLPADVTEDEIVALGRERHIRLGSRLGTTTKPFRIALVLVMLVALLSLPQRVGFQLPAIPAQLGHLNLAIYALVAIGLLTVGLTSEPWQAGVGMLTFLTGFELFYSALEQSVALLAALAAVNLVVTLVISYLTQARHEIPALVD